MAIRLLHYLELLHGIGIVHCDVKMDNILVEGQCNHSGKLPPLYLIDMGLAFNYEVEQCNGRPRVTRKQDLLGMSGKT